MRYRFLNQSAKPVTLTVAFPLPDIDLSEGDNFAIPASDSVNFLGFETKIDGKPVTFTMNQRAVVGDKDVSALLRGLKVPLFALGVQHDTADLTPAARDKRSRRVSWFRSGRPSRASRSTAPAEGEDVGGAPADLPAQQAGAGRAPLQGPASG